MHPVTTVAGMLCEHQGVATWKTHVCSLTKLKHTFVHLQSVHVVTSAAFHPQNSDLLGYSTTKTVLSIVDLRQKDLRGDSALSFVYSPNMVWRYLLAVVPIVLSKCSLVTRQTA